MNSRVPSRTLCSLLETISACPLPQKDWATLMLTCHRYRYLLVTKHLANKQSVTDYFSACRNYLAKIRLSFPSAPRWDRHSYLLKGLQLNPMHLRLINGDHINLEDTSNAHRHLFLS
jgi:hypothetical protein